MKEIITELDLTNTVFLGVDIGTVACKAVLMKARKSDRDDYSYEILSIASRPSIGATDRSKITNVDSILQILRELIQEVIQNQPKLEQNDHQKIYTTFGVHDKSIRCQITRVSNLFSKHNREVRTADVNTVLNMAGNTHLENDREYLHIMPRLFYVNDVMVDEKNLVGQMGSSVDAEVLLISVLREHIAQIWQCAQAVDYTVDCLCATATATGEGVLTKREREEGSIIIDFGAGITSAVVFERKKPVAMVQVPFGGIDITSDLAQVLQVPMDIAERIKCQYGVVDKEYFSTNTTDIRIQDDQRIIDIKIEVVYNTVLARTIEILNLVKQQLVASIALPSQERGQKPYSIVVTGGSGCLLGLMQLVEYVFNSNARIAQPWNWGGPYEHYSHPSYSAVIGLCIVGLQDHLTKRWDSSGENERHTKKRKSSFDPRVKQLLYAIGEKFRSLLSIGDIE